MFESGRGRPVLISVLTVAVGVGSCLDIEDCVDAGW
jgi:hypothetical protein